MKFTFWFGRTLARHLPPRELVVLAMEIWPIVWKRIPQEQRLDFLKGVAQQNLGSFLVDLNREEVDFLMRLAEEYATHELPELQRNGIRLQLMGKREGLPNSVVNALDRAIFQTRDNSRMILNLAVNYGGRTEIIDAIKAILTAHGQGTIDGSKLDESIIARYLYCPDCPDVDIVIRTSGECRLSNFLIWRVAQAVLWSTPVLWPDFQQEQFQEAMRIYEKVHSRQYIGS